MSTVTHMSHFESSGDNFKHHNEVLSNKISDFCEFAQSDKLSLENYNQFILSIISAKELYTFFPILNIKNVITLGNTNDLKPYFNLLQIFAFKDYAYYLENKEGLNLPLLDNVQTHKLQLLSLLTFAKFNKTFSLTSLQNYLRLTHPNDVEHLCTHAIELGLLQGKIDQISQIVTISWAQSRDIVFFPNENYTNSETVPTLNIPENSESHEYLTPPTMPDILNKLENWYENNAILVDILEREIRQLHEKRIEKQQIQKLKMDYLKKLEEKCSNSDILSPERNMTTVMSNNGTSTNNFLLDTKNVMNNVYPKNMIMFNHLNNSINPNSNNLISSNSGYQKDFTNQTHNPLLNNNNHREKFTKFMSNLFVNNTNMVTNTNSPNNIIENEKTNNLENNTIARQTATTSKIVGNDPISGTSSDNNIEFSNGMPHINGTETPSISMDQALDLGEISTNISAENRHINLSNNYYNNVISEPQPSDTMNGSSVTLETNDLHLDSNNFINNNDNLSTNSCHTTPKKSNMVNNSDTITSTSPTSPCTSTNFKRANKLKTSLKDSATKLFQKSPSLNTSPNSTTEK